MTEPKLKILLLGPPVVYLEDKPVHIPRKIVRALLFFLAGEHTFVSRNRIINTFWPEENETDARRHLREILSKLRNALPFVDALVTDQDQVSLDFHKVYVDLYEFSEVVNKNWNTFKPTRDKLLDPETFKEFDRLIFLWRSPRFMAGFNSPDSVDFDIWIRKMGLSMESYRRQIMKILAEDTAARGDLITSLWWLHKAFEEDEFDTELQFLYLNTLYQLGRTREALDFFVDLQNLYTKEGLGEIPATIQDLEKKIRAASLSPVQTNPIHWPGTVDLSIPFIGRKNVLDDIGKVYDRGGCVILRGEAGLGKSRLAFELYQKIYPRPILFFAQGRSQETDLPFQPLIDSLRRSITLKEWKKLDPVHRGSLSRLMPELTTLEVTENLSLPSSGEQGRAAVFEAFYQLLLGLSTDNRVIFFVDDAHWCDRSSLEVLGYLEERGFFLEHGLLLLTARVEEKDVLLEVFLADQKKPNLVQTFSLERFGYNEVFQLADAMLGFAPSNALVQRLMLDAGGNPLMLIETLRAMQKLGLDADQINAVRNIPLAGSIRVLLRNRLKQLDEETKDVLSSAAVIGYTFSTSLLEKACTSKNLSFVSAIEELERVNLIQAVMEEPLTGKYSFIHEKIRESLLLEISPVRISLIHEQIAKAIEETGPTSQQAAVIADHFQKAGRIHESFHYWIEAGIHARSIFSPHVASQAFQNAEKLFLQSEILMDVKEIHRLYTQWAGLKEERNDAVGLANCFDKMIEWGRKRQSPLLVGSGLSGMAHFEILKLNPLKAREYIEEAEVYVIQSGNKVELSSLKNHQGIIYQLTSEMDKAAECYRESLSLTEGMLDQWVLAGRANLLTRISILYIFLGDTQNALKTTDENIHLGEQTGNHLAACWGYAMKSLAQSLSADYEQGIKTAQQGLQIANSIQNQHIQAYLYIALGKNELDFGNLKDAWDHINQSIKLSREYKHLEVLSQAYEGMSELYLSLRNYPKAAEIAAMGMKCFNNNFQMYWNQLICGFAHLLKGDLKIGEEKINQVLEITRKSGINYVYFPALVCEAFVNIAKGNLPTARESLYRVIDLCKPRDMHLQIYLSHWMLAMISQIEGDLKGALDIAEKATNIAQKIHNPWLQINGHLMIAKIRQQLELGVAEQQERIDELTEQIKNSGIPSELREDFDNFLTQIVIN
jgi:DNA-binding SARP family transcriptional activator